MLFVKFNAIVRSVRSYQRDGERDVPLFLSSTHCFDGQLRTSPVNLSGARGEDEFADVFRRSDKTMRDVVPLVVFCEKQRNQLH